MNCNNNNTNILGVNKGEDLQLAYPIIINNDSLYMQFFFFFFTLFRVYKCSKHIVHDTHIECSHRNQIIGARFTIHLYVKTFPKISLVHNYQYQTPQICFFLFFFFKKKLFISSSFVSTPFELKNILLSYFILQLLLNFQFKDISFDKCV